MIKIIDQNIFEADVDVILHQVNSHGVMGSGVAKQVKERYPLCYEAYKGWCSDPKVFGTCFAYLNAARAGGDGKTIVNMLAQKNFGYDGKQYTDLIALENCLKEVRADNRISKQKIGIPYLMSCDRGGADWKVVEGMVLDILGDCDVVICRFKGN